MLAFPFQVQDNICSPLTLFTEPLCFFLNRTDLRIHLVFPQLLHSNNLLSTLLPYCTLLLYYLFLQFCFQNCHSALFSFLRNVLHSPRNLFKYTLKLIQAPFFFFFFFSKYRKMCRKPIRFTVNLSYLF